MNLALRATLACLALAATSAAAAQPKAPAALVRKWDFGPDGEGAPSCTLTFGPGLIIGGFELTVPKACAKAMRNAADLYSWDLDPKGAVVLRDAVRHIVLRLEGDGTGAAFSTSGPGVGYILSKAGKPPTLAERMSGRWRLVAFGGTPLCDYDVASAPDGMSGSLRPRAGCKAPWAGRNFSRWALTGRRITLSDAAGLAKVVISDCGMGGCDGTLPNGDFIGFTPIFE